MVGTLIKLNLTLTRRQLFASPMLAVITVVIFGVQATVAVNMVRQLLALGPRPDAVHAASSTMLFGIYEMGWLMMMLLVSGADVTLDMGRFALLPVQPRTLRTGLTVITLTGMGGLTLVAMVTASAITWVHNPGVLAATLFGGLLGIVSTMVWVRTLGTLLSGVFRSRRVRDIGVVIGTVVGVLIAIGFQTASTSMFLGHRGVVTLAPWASVMEWTPMGWPWALTMDAVAGDWVGAGVRVLLTVVMTIGCWHALGLLVQAGLTSPLESTGSSEQVKDQPWLERLVPDTPWGAVALRSLRYWRRDPRHLAQLARLALMPAVMLVPLSVQSVFNQPSVLLLIGTSFAGLMNGVTIMAQELSFDGSALWIHIVAGVSGRDDLKGRLAACLVVILPCQALIDVAALLLLGAPWRMLPTAIGVSLALMLVSMGVGTVLGAIVQLPQPPPGKGAFARSGNGGMAAGLAMSGAMILCLVLSIPFIVAAGVAFFLPILGWVELLVLPAIGSLFLWLGAWLGGRRLDRTWPEVIGRITWRG